MSQQQSTNPGQPQASQAAHPAEQHLIAAGVPQQALDQAKAHGLNVGALVGLIGQLLPIILQFVQQQSQPQGQPQAVVSDPDVGKP